jgi:hypothetical protein
MHYDVSITERKKKIGGVGKVVEIDEALFRRRKYRKGKVKTEIWVVGGIERKSTETINSSRKKNVFFEVIADRKEDTLTDVIKRRVKEGTHIITDCWSSYQNLNKYNYSHSTVNHSKEFKNKLDGSHTNNIEGIWHHVRVGCGNYGSRGYKLSSKLIEYTYRSKKTLNSFLEDIGKSNLKNIEEISNMNFLLKKEEMNVEKKERKTNIFSFLFNKLKKNKELNNNTKKEKIETLLEKQKEDINVEEDSESLICNNIEIEKIENKKLKRKLNKIIFEEDSYEDKDIKSDSDVERDLLNFDKKTKRKRKALKAKSKDLNIENEIEEEIIKYKQRKKIIFEKRKNKLNKKRNLTIDNAKKLMASTLSSE